MDEQGNQPPPSESRIPFTKGNVVLTLIVVAALLLGAGLKYFDVVGWVIGFLIATPPLVVLVILLGYRVERTGFREGEERPKKTLWDWMQLLSTASIPVVIAVGGCGSLGLKMSVTERSRRGVRKTKHYRVTLLTLRKSPRWQQAHPRRWSKLTPL